MMIEKQINVPQKADGSHFYMIFQKILFDNQVNLSCFSPVRIQPFWISLLCKQTCYLQMTNPIQNNHGQQNMHDSRSRPYVLILI